MSPRPVTPVGILARGLDELRTRVAADPELAAATDHLLAMAGGLEGYVARCTTTASPALDLIEHRTLERDWGEASALEAEMLSGHAEGRLLDFLARALRAQRVLDIGMFTGYSSLAMAQALEPGGEVIALELDEGAAAIARECFAESEAGDRITIRVGPASESLAELAGASPFDLIFLDADKPGYAGYLEQVLEGGLLASGGLLCADNTLMQGEPWAGESPGGNGAAIAAFNDAVAADPRVEQVLVPMRDGITLIRHAR